MPSGKVHETINTGFLVAQAAAWLGGALALPAQGVWSYLAGFALGTYLITPDLDLAERQEPRPLKWWGPLKVLWWPYGMIFKHRGLSHSWVLGPLSRIAYLAILAASAGLLARFDLRALILEHPLEASLFTLGYLLSQWIHLVLDLWTQETPRGGRRKRARKKSSLGI